MQHVNDFEALMSTLAKRIADELFSQLDRLSLPERQQRLLTVEQAATYLGRTEEAMHHLIGNRKIPTVRVDRRVFLDIRDLDALIDGHKHNSRR